MRDKTKEKANDIRPHNIEAEQNLLGLLLVNNENLLKIGDSFTMEYFYLPIHQKIYEGITRLVDRGLVSDPITIKNYFAKEEIFNNSETNSYGYLLKLVEEAELNSDIKTLTINIYETYIRRRIINLGESYIIKARDQNFQDEVESLIEGMESELYQLGTNQSYNNKTYFLTESIKGALEKIEKSLKNKHKLSGIETGYSDLNNYTGGFQPSDLIIIAGRPSMGKTALTVNIALRAAKSFAREHINDKTIEKKSVCFISLEMSAEQLASRILAIETKIDGSKIRVGKISKEEFKNLSEQMSLLNDIPIIIDDSPALTISAIRTKARRMKRQHNLAMLVIDYLQLISISKNKENRVQEIAEISQGLKSIAKELNIPVITASQLSRAVESREDKRPLLSDLRESGNIEQDADIVIFIYREEYYLSRKIPSSDEKKLLEWQEKMEKVENVAEIMISKQRNGPIGNLSLRYDNRTTAFDNLM